MIGSSQNADLEARFGHLLQPIRDLTRNWDVDIASYLEEYLEDLEHVVVTFNDGSTTMNFAEAALLIQGSACVYSKKVEYLYKLVYQVMDMIVHKKQQHKSSVDAEGKDNDADFPEVDADVFLALDDTKGAKIEKLQNPDDPEKECRVHPQTPMNLIAKEEGEKDAGELNNHKGELLGCMSDFQMNSSCILPQGGICLDSSLLPLLHSHLRILASSTPYPAPRHDKAPLEKSANSDELLGMPPHPEVGYISLNDGGDADFEPLDNGPPVEEELLQAKLALNAEDPRKSEKRKVQFALPKPVVDHWALTDPFSESRHGERKLKKGITFRIPPSIDHKATKKRKRKTAAKGKELDIPIAEFVQSKVHSRRNQLPKSPALAPTFPEFEDLFWKEFTRRQQAKRESLRLAKEQVRQQEVEAEDADFEGDAEEGLAIPGEDVDVLTAVTGGDDDDDDDFGETANFEPLLLQLAENALACGGDFINSLGSSSSTYEDVVRQHIDNFMAQAARYAQTTDLTKRVTEWEEKITPRLLEEEQRETFDIHQYGTKVIEGLKRNDLVPFHHIVTGKPLFQICRLFLATLQLANTYNVEICCPGQLYDAMDTMQLRLLSTKRHFEELADYQAPSLSDNSH